MASPHPSAACAAALSQTPTEAHHPLSRLMGCSRRDPLLGTVRECWAVTPTLLPLHLVEELEDDLTWRWEACLLSLSV